jgi:regulator of protease activity HflC (stomatin/prohibitin superfamily)
MDSRPASKETSFTPKSGFPMLAVLVLLLPASILAFAGAEEWDFGAVGVVLGIVLSLAFFFVMPGFFIVNPNMARVLVLFGRYRGTVRTDGFWWTNPFTVKTKVSVRAHNLNGQRLKVNDLIGNPIEIAAVVVWRVRDTAQAVFDVEAYADYVEVQSESALRHLASKHPYDDGQSPEVTTSLRGSRDEVSEELQRELTERLARAGIEVLEAFLSHLAYAPEIASAMLQRQQAGAVIAARAKIVEGAVGMVEHALQMLGERKVIDLDEERRAQMVANLLVVLCSHNNPTPVLNAGSLYS